MLLRGAAGRAAKEGEEEEKGEFGFGLRERRATALTRLDERREEPRELTTEHEAIEQELGALALAMLPFPSFTTDLPLAHHSSATKTRTRTTLLLK